MRGEKHPMWRGGRTVTPAGYVAVRVLGHPRASNAGYVLEHVLIVERALGKPLPVGAEVHHVDEDKANNDTSNLVLCQDRAYHMLLHRRQRALDACGNANAHRCKYCGGYDNQDDITVENLRAGFFSAYHRRCGARYQQLRKLRSA